MARRQDRPPIDAGHEIAIDDWEWAHAGPLWLHGPHRDEVVADLKTEIGILAKERPAAAQAGPSQVRAWTDAVNRPGPVRGPTTKL